MKNYICLEDAIDALRKYQYPYGVEFLISNLPKCDVEPVIHGKWIGYDASYYRNYNFGKHPVNLIRFKCSVCGKTVSKKEKYCHCGAKMD